MHIRSSHRNSKLISWTAPNLPDKNIHRQRELRTELIQTNPLGIINDTLSTIYTLPIYIVESAIWLYERISSALFLDGRCAHMQITTRASLFRKQCNSATICKTNRASLQPRSSAHEFVSTFPHARAPVRGKFINHLVHRRASSLDWARASKHRVRLCADFCGRGERANDVYKFCARSIRLCSTTKRVARLPHIVSVAKRSCLCLNTPHHTCFRYDGALFAAWRWLFVSKDQPRDVRLMDGFGVGKGVAERTTDAARMDCEQSFMNARGFCVTRFSG